MLKKKNKIIVFLSFVLLIAACNGGKGAVNFKKPEKVAVFFMKSLASWDITAAKKVATDDTKKVLSLLETMAATLSEKDKEAMIAKSSATLKQLKKANCSTNDDIAKCTICCDENKQVLPYPPFTLKKIGKKWLVDMNKEELMPN